MSLEHYRQLIDNLTHRAALATATVAQEKATVAQATAELDATKEALAVAVTLAEDMQQRAHQYMTRVVAQCLTLVFEEPYEFRIHFETRASKTEASLAFVRNGLVLEDPKFEVGIGVIDIAAFGLRLAALMFSLPQRRRVIIMDEPFKHISVGRRGARVAAMLEVLAAEFNMQFIMITHMPELQTGTIIEVE